MTEACAVPVSGWTVLRAVKWTVLHAVRWTRVIGTGVVLLVAALFIQPPAQGAPAAPAKADPSLYAQSVAHPSETFPVIVREAAPNTDSAESLVKSLGGRVTHELGIVGGFSALVPGSAVPELSASPLVWRVWGDAPVHMQGVSMGQYDYAAANTVWKQVINLPKTNNQYTGAGVTVALVDTGVVPVPDLASRIVHALDLTGEADGLDRYGHGTHMAGIIAGTGAASGGTYSGVAPGANLVSIKVAGLDGSTDASVVMAGLQWAVTHRAQYNIKVLNLSFGTDGTQSYSIDPLDYAVEQAWRAGIFVVVSAGNRGSAPGTINKPGDDPFVMTVGAADLDNTTNSSDDTVAPFSSEGPTQDSLAKPDVVAPGVTIVSTRDPGSYVDVNHPAAVVAGSYFKGTGTSQAAAVVSGIAALMYQANPNLSPDVVKAELVHTTTTSPWTGQPGSGSGLVDAWGAVQAAKNNKYASSPANAGLVPSTGQGSLQGSRGSVQEYVMHCAPGSTTCSPTVLSGEGDALGNSWSGNSWSGTSWSGNSWSGNSWSGGAWSGNSWSGNSWSGNSWSGNSWSGNSWSGNSWS